ncbi:MAG: PAP2 family protein, partial [Sphingomonas sp.]
MPPTITNATAPPNALPVRGGTTVSPLPGWWAGVALLTCLAMLAWLMERADLNIDPVAPASIVFVLVFAAAGAVLYALRAPASRRQRILRDLTEYYALFTAIALIGAMASYPVAAETRGFVDGGLAYTDALLHFRWLSWYHVVADHRVLQLLGTIAYQSIYVSPAVLLGHFARVGDRMRAYRFITAFWV